MSPLVLKTVLLPFYGLFGWFSSERGTRYIGGGVGVCKSSGPQLES